MAFGIDNSTRCEKGMDSTTKETCCNNWMNQSREVNPRECCDYPYLALFKWQYEPCQEKCGVNQTDGGMRCCFLACYFKQLKVIGNDSQSEIDVEGLKFSYLISVS